MSKMNAWVIEDDHLSGDIFSLALREAHYEAFVVRDGAEAMERLTQVAQSAAPHPDLIILDIHLPGVSGERILEYIRSSPNLAQTKVVILTADPVAVETLSDQSDLALIKPVGFNQLKELAARLAMEIQARKDQG
jgi:DNA-binding response OmpR family regulator